MSRRANPKIVGGFVLAAIALLVGGALVFGSFSFFEVTRTAVVFFEGSVDGLTQGSGVVFRGFRSEGSSMSEFVTTRKPVPSQSR